MPARSGTARVEFVDARLPPGGHARDRAGSKVSRWPTDCGLPKSTEIATRTPQGRMASAMRAICGCECGREQSRIGIHIIDGAAIDAERGEQAGVIGRAREVLAHVVVLPEDGITAVAAFDGAVEAVPMVHPAHRCVGGLALVEIGKALAHGDLAQQREGAVEQAAVVGGGDDGEMQRALGGGFQPEGVGGESRFRNQAGRGATDLVDRPEQDGALVWNGGLGRAGCGRACLSRRGRSRRVRWRPGRIGRARKPRRVRTDGIDRARRLRAGRSATSAS